MMTGTNRLTVIGPAVAGRVEFMVYRCACGAEVTRSRRAVRYGRVKSCGCLSVELKLARNTKHGRATRANRDPEYVLWQGMKARCLNPRNKAYRYYGGRGITVCASWLADYTAFLRDVGMRPDPSMSLDRIDNGGNYEPGNVRWATRAEQVANKRPRSVWSHQRALEGTP